MLGMAPTREPRLVARFALASLLAFVLVAVGALSLLVRNARDRAELVGARHATFVGQAVLAPLFAGIDLDRPVTGDQYRRAVEAVRSRVLSDGLAVRVKIWRPDGTIVFSDEPALVGKRFPDEAPELAEVAQGHLEMGVTDLEHEENEFERPIANTLFFTYAPLRTRPDGPIVAVAEIYQDYSFIQDDIDAVVRRVAVIVVGGLAILYALLLPIALRASRELRRRNEQLAELLQREQVTVAELRDLARQKDDFVSAASHELRSPLTSILGSLATLRQRDIGDDPAARSEFLEAAERQAKRLERMVENLLTEANLEQSRPVELADVDLTEAATAVVAELGATDRVALDLPAGSVRTDRARIVEVLRYLLDNALKYSPKGSVVTVRATIEEGELRLLVSDLGPGIAPDDQAEIFERFHQVDQSSTRTHDGLGLGLHLARELIEELRGRVEVDSGPGRGSTFTVTVPTEGSGRVETAAVNPSPR
jgi:signal transduction histidine kinase